MPSLGFGLEKLGNLAVGYPRICMGILLILTAVCATGLPRLEADDAISDLFRSDTKHYHDYASMSERFPVSEYDVLVIIEGKTLLQPAILETLRTLHFDLQLSETVSGLLSIFSMRGKPNERGYPPPLIPDELPGGEKFDALVKRITDNPLVKGKFFARTGSGELAVYVLSLDQETRAERGLKSVVNEIRDISKSAIKDGQVTVKFAGAPMMQLEIRESIKRDRIIYNSAGFLIGFIVNMIFFRRFRLVVIASICPALAVIWGLGILGLAGEKLNSFNNVIPPLVMVIAFTDAMHMMFSIRRKLGQGHTRREAVLHAIKTVGPACVLTSVTTSLALLSLTFTDSGLIRSFGFASAFGTLIAFISVITVIPTLTVLFVDEEKFRKSEAVHRKVVDWLENACMKLAGWLQQRYLEVLLTSIAIIITFAYMHTQLEPRYRLSDEVPGNKQAVAASLTIDKALTGAHPIHIMVHWPESATFRSETMLNILAEAHRILEKQPGVGNVWSVETLRRWAREAGNGDIAVVSGYIDRLPSHLTSRFINEDMRAALVTGRLPNLTSTDAVKIMQQLNTQLQDLRNRWPGYEFSVTGLSALSALQSSNMIGQLNRGLLIAVIVVTALMGFAFRSLKMLAFAVTPNLFPILTAGAWLYMTGRGLEYASVIAMTVGFGLAVDDTIHFLARLQYERAQKHAETLHDAVRMTLARIGPVFVLTTTVLVLGLFATVFSELYSMRLFGELTMMTLTAALIGDAIILPAIIFTFAYYQQSRKIKAPTS